MGIPTSRAGWDDAVRNTARLAALRRTGMLDSPPEEAFDRLTRLATSVLSVRGAFVSLVDEDRQFFKSSVGVPEPWASLRQTPLTHSFCKHAVASGEPLLISDSRQTPLVRDNPGVTELRLVAYAGIPLKTTEGHTLGAFCVMHDRPHAWTDATSFDSPADVSTGRTRSGSERSSYSPRAAASYEHTSGVALPSMTVAPFSRDSCTATSRAW